MKLIIGRGNARQVYELGSVQARSREETELLSWNITQVCFQRGIIPSLGGRR
jgi:hypothetical protein